MVKKYLKILLISIFIFTQVFPFSGKYVYAAEDRNLTELFYEGIYRNSDNESSLEETEKERKAFLATCTEGELLLLQDYANENDKHNLDKYYENEEHEKEAEEYLNNHRNKFGDDLSTEDFIKYTKQYMREQLPSMRTYINQQIEAGVGNTGDEDKVEELTKKIKEKYNELKNKYDDLNDATDEELIEIKNLFLELDEADGTEQTSDTGELLKIKMELDKILEGRGIKGIGQEENESIREAEGDISENASDSDSILNNFGGLLLKPLLWLFNSIADAIIAATARFMGTSDTYWILREKDDEYITGDEVQYKSASDSKGATVVITPNEDSDDGSSSEYIESSYKIPYIKYSCEEIFANKVGLLDVNFIKNDASLHEDGDSWTKIRSIIIVWYRSLLILALVGLLSVLIYTGIKIMLSTTAGQQAKYKQNLLDWIMAFVILVSIPLIMSFTLTVSEQLTKMFTKSGNSTFSIKVYLEEYGASFYTNMIGLARFKIQSKGAIQKITYEIIYIALIALTVRFTIMYIQRMLKMAFLTMIAPIVGLMYPIDKLRGNSNTSYSSWLKEFIYNALLQPFHYLIYYIFIGSSIGIAADNPIYAIVVLLFLSKAEGIFKQLFGLQPGMAGGVPGDSLANAALATSLVSNLSQARKTISDMTGIGSKNKRTSSDDDGSDDSDGNSLADLASLPAAGQAADAVLGRDTQGSGEDDGIQGKTEPNPSDLLRFNEKQRKALKEQAAETGTDSQEYKDLLNRFNRAKNLTKEQQDELDGLDPKSDDYLRKLEESEKENAEKEQQEMLLDDYQNLTSEQQAQLDPNNPEDQEEIARLSRENDLSDEHRKELADFAKEKGIEPGSDEYYDKLDELERVEKLTPEQQKKLKEIKDPEEYKKALAGYEEENKNKGKNIPDKDEQKEKAKQSEMPRGSSGNISLPTNMPEEFKNISTGKAIANLAKKKMKRIQSDTKQKLKPKKIAKKAFRLWAKGSAAVTLAAIQAGISIADGKYNPAEALATGAAVWLGTDALLNKGEQKYNKFAKEVNVEKYGEKMARGMDRERKFENNNAYKKSFDEKYDNQSDEYFARGANMQRSANLTEKQTHVALAYSDALREQWKKEQEDSLSSYEARERRKAISKTLDENKDFSKALDKKYKFNETAEQLLDEKYGSQGIDWRSEHPDWADQVATQLREQKITEMAEQDNWFETEEAKEMLQSETGKEVESVFAPENKYTAEQRNDMINDMLDTDVEVARAFENKYHFEDQARQELVAEGGNYTEENVKERAQLLRNQKVQEISQQDNWLETEEAQELLQTENAEKVKTIFDPENKYTAEQRNDMINDMLDTDVEVARAFENKYHFEDQARQELSATGENYTEENVKERAQLLRNQQIQEISKQDDWFEKEGRDVFTSKEQIKLSKQVSEANDRAKQLYQKEVAKKENERQIRQAQGEQLYKIMDREKREYFKDENGNVDYEKVFADDLAAKAVKTTDSLKDVDGKKREEYIQYKALNAEQKAQYENAYAHKDNIERLDKFGSITATAPKKVEVKDFPISQDDIKAQITRQSKGNKETENTQRKAIPPAGIKDTSKVMKKTINKNNQKQPPTPPPQQRKQQQQKKQQRQQQQQQQPKKQKKQQKQQ